jgi:LexA-binding, inner membrane-associated putative hydrolase
VSKKTLLRLLAQLTFGIDTIVGLGSYVVLSFLFGEEYNVWFLLFAGFCSYLPDLDFTYFVFQSKKVRKWGHWRYGFHHTILFLPLIGMGTLIGSLYFVPDHSYFLTTLAIVCVFGHFVHDSTKTGLHWFSPITRDWRISFNALRWLNVKVTRHGLHILSHEEVVARYADTARKSLSGGKSNEVDTRIESVTKAQLVCFTILIIGLVTLFFK